MSALTYKALRQLADGRFHSGEQVARSLGRSRAALSEALKRAPEMGVQIFKIPGKGYRLAEPVEFLDAGAVIAALGPEQQRLHLEVLDEVDSTSTRLLALAAAGAPGGTCLAAECQSAGRGRRGRAWISGLGASLTFSLLWRFERGAGHLSGLSLAAGVAVARALRSIGVARAQVKWPNDVVVDFRKIAGILVETSGEMEGPSTAVIGVGANFRLGEALKGRIDQPVIDVASCVPAGASRNRLFARILTELVKALEAFERSGFAAARAEWRSLHACQGRRVRVLTASGSSFEAEVEDVAEDGTLVVAGPEGTLRLASGEISLAGTLAASVRAVP
jgi:BirA family biotin operon repressor/biotin-[acetyl-CoA-carboxylase] ligase